MSDERDGSVHAAAGRSDRRPFSHWAHVLTEWTGTGWAAATIMGAFVVWMVVGALSGFARWWELSATVGLPFLTLLMLALVQHTQNHNALAIQLKLDELIRASGPASNQMMTVEHSSREDLERIQADFRSQSEEPSGPGSQDRGPG